jgi:uncharacterized protein YnzC (UPF0291/DUF896 family)
MDRAEYQELINPEAIFKWLERYRGHEHLADIKKVSLEKFLAVAPDPYVMAAMLSSVLRQAQEQKMFAEYGKDEEKIKPYNELTEEEKVAQAAERKAYMRGLRAGRDTAMIEMANRITAAARQQLNNYRLKNSEYAPALVVDESVHGELE